MSILGNDLLLAGTDEGYNLTRSLRFRSSASASLSRTPASAGNRKTWTWSAWVKRGSLSSNQVLFVSKPSATSDATFTTIGFSSSNTLLVSGYSVQWRNTTQVFRDPSAWYHIVVTWDTTQATAANRVKVYVNGSQVTAFGTTFDPSLNFDGAINQADAHYFCYPDGYSYSYFDGYLTEVNFVDGQGLTPSSFGETDTITGVWKPKRYAGTYNTNGFYLPFTDNSALTTSSNVGLGKDFSGNGNYWTTNNISITSGTTYDSMTDVPTLTSATAANFAVLNPLDKGSNVSVTEGNLLATISSTGGVVLSSIGISSGKWYWEMTRNGGADCVIGIANSSVSRTAYLGSDANGWGYIGSNGNKVNNGSSASYGSSYATNIVIGVALDMDSGTVTFYRNNVSQGTAYSSLTGTIYAAFGTGNNTDSVYANFGQRPFSYTPPTGYVALNTYNLPTSTIVKGNTVMDATLWTGNNTSRSIANAAPFKPDLVWIKSRSNAEWNILFDSVRGTGKSIYSNSTNAEVTNAGSGYVSAFNSDGFSVVGGSTDSANVNATGYTYVGWQWQAGQGTTSSNTSGTITSTVSVNASAGFSIVTWTGNGTSGATIGHGLGVAPSMILIKRRQTPPASADWIVYHQSVGNTGALVLNQTVGTQAGSFFWNNTSPSSSVISLGNDVNVNNSGNTYVAYCWTPIAGYSAFGSYTGNGSADGTFVYTGFRPRWIMFKITSGSGGSWIIYDTARKTYNVNDTWLYANYSDAEYVTPTYDLLDILSNGFKWRSANYLNVSGDTLIYMAFAETPTKFALAR